MHFTIYECIILHFNIYRNTYTNENARQQMKHRPSVCACAYNIFSVHMDANIPIYTQTALFAKKTRLIFMAINRIWHRPVVTELLMLDMSSISIKSHKSHKSLGPSSLIWAGDSRAYERKSENWWCPTVCCFVFSIYISTIAVVRSMSMSLMILLRCCCPLLHRIHIAITIAMFARHEFALYNKFLARASKHTNAHNTPQVVKTSLINM